MPKISKKDSILCAALSLFHEKGWEATAVSEIVQAVGAAQGTFYYYFKSKEELADALVEKMVDKRLRPLVSLSDDEDLSAYEKLIKFIHLSFLVPWESDLERETVHHPLNGALRHKLHSVMNKSLEGLLITLIKYGVKEDYFKVESPSAVASFMLNGLQFLRMEGIMPETEKEMVRELGTVGEIIEKLVDAKTGSFLKKHKKLRKAGYLEVV